jgi:MoxR-like ATPase
MPASPIDRPAPITLSPAELAIALRACLRARQPVCVHGPVGIGKTQTVRQAIASIAGATLQVEPAARRDPTDYSGIPFPDQATRTAIFYRPSFFDHATQAAESHPDLPHAIFWDEFNRAPAAVQNVALNIILENQTGEHVLPSNVCHILAVNDAQDSAGTTQMSEAARNRVIHLYGRTDYASWNEWATATLAADRKPAEQAAFQFHCNTDDVTGRVRHELIAYMQDNPDALHQFDRHADAFPTPRSWEFVSRIIDATLPPNVERALICGAVGVPHGTQFYAYLGMVRQLAGKFSFARALANPTGEPIPSEVSARYAIANAFAQRLEPANVQAAMQYVNRLPGEYQAFVVLGAIRRTGGKESPLHACGPITQWKLAHQDMF